MRILIGAHTPNDLRLGVARVMHFVGQGWSQVGHQVDFLYAGDVPGIIPRGRLPWINFALGAVAVIRSREREGIHYDLLNFHGGDGCFAGLYDWVRGRKRRLVVSLHGVEEMLWRVEREERRLGYAPTCSVKEYAARYALRRSQILLSVRLASCATVLSRAEREFVVQHYGVSPDRVVVVPNGMPAQCLIEREYPETAERLLFVGTWYWRKGTHYLVEALAQLVSIHPDITLSLVGTGTTEAAVRADFPEHLWPHVRIVPTAPNVQVQREYRSHDVFVLPSLFEGSSLALLEAMASGMPVVVSDAAGAAREFIQSGEDGVLFPARDVDGLVRAIGQLLDDVDLRCRLGLNAQRKMHEQTWDKVAHRWMEAIQGVGQRDASDTTA